MKEWLDYINSRGYLKLKVIFPIFKLIMLRKKKKKDDKRTSNINDKFIL